MPEAIRPLETMFRGFRFRSRLEARWALFFEVLGIKWDYEVQGFELPSGAYYLPDFYLPEVGLHAEVKPTLPTSGEDYLKIQDFVLAKPENAILLLDGRPDFRLYQLIQRVEDEVGTDSWILWALLDIHSKPKWFIRQHRLAAGFEFEEFSRPEDFTEKYREAVYASRAERF